MSLMTRTLPMVLLGSFALLAISSMRRNSITGDEVTHLPAGYTYVRTGDFRLNMQHPPLIKMLAGLPLLWLDLKPVEAVKGWKRGREWIFGTEFLTENRTPLQRIVFAGRLPMVGIGVLMGLLLFVWARDLWGDGPGLFVLFLYTLCPNMLAHTPIVHTDMGVSCFTVLTLYALWRFTRTGLARYVVLCGVSLGLTLLAKYSGVITALVVAVLLTVSRWTGTPGDVDPERARSWGDRLRPRRLLGPAAAGVAIAALAGALVAGLFECPHGLANYSRGFTLIHADANPHWEGFLWGEYSKRGFWYYYLLAQLWKTPIPALACFASALFLIPAAGKATRLDWWFILLPITAFHAAGMLKPASIGIRHVLPAFPFIYLACGATAHWIGRQRKALKMLFALLCAWYAAGTLRVYPDFIPYFNELAGGPDGGIFYLDDSNIEWGQGYYALQRYLDEHRPPRVRLLAFEPIPRRYYDIQAEPIKLEDAVWPQPGFTYLVGASYLQRSSLFDGFPGVRFHWLERYRPVDKIGWSIFVYRFSTNVADQNRADVFYVPVAQWYEDAVSSLQAMVARHPKFAYARDVLAQVYAARAGWLEGQGKAEAALLDYLGAVATAPDPARYRPAVRSAISRLESAVGTESAPIAVTFRQAALWCNEKQYAHCVLWLLRTLKRDEDHLLAHMNLGSVYMQLGFPGLARREWERCLRINSEHAGCRQNLAALQSRDRRAQPPPASEPAAEVEEP